MFMECDEIAIDADLWQRVKSGDGEAKTQLSKQIAGLVLYVHALSEPGGSVCVSTREVCAALNDRLTLTIGFDA